MKASKGYDNNAIIIRYPNASNLSEFDPLLMYYNIDYLNNNHAKDADVIILPPSRDMFSDLDWLNGNGLADWIRYMAKRGKKIIGVEEGYAMLLSSIIGHEGLGLIDAKIIDIVAINDYANVDGKRCYISKYFKLACNPSEQMVARYDGREIVIGLRNNNVIGYSAYGLITSILNIHDQDSRLDKEIDKVARIVEKAIDIDRIKNILGLA